MNAEAGQHWTQRPVSRRAALGGVGAAATSIALAACSGSSGGATTIRFYQTKPEVVTYFDKLITQYHRAQTKVRVVHDSTSSVAAQFVRGNVPDLALLNYNLDTARYVARGVLTDLSDVPAAATIQPGVQALVNQYATWKGQTSVLPYSITACGVIYNKALFAKAGVTPPTTFAELLQVCKKLKAKGITPFYATYKDPWTIRQGFFDYSVGGSLPDVARFYKQLDKEGAAVGPSSSVSFSKTLAGPIDKMLQLTQFSNPDAPSKSYPDGNLNFAQSKAAMYLQGPWALGEIALTSKRISIGQFPLPMTEDPADRKVRVNLDLAAWIPQGSGNKAAARDFLNWLMQPSIINRYNADNLAYGVTKTAPAPTDRRISDLAPYVSASKFYQGATTYLPNAIPADGLVQSLVLTRQPGPVLSTLDSDWNRLQQRSA